MHAERRKSLYATFSNWLRQTLIPPSLLSLPGAPPLPKSGKLPVSLLVCCDRDSWECRGHYAARLQINTHRRICTTREEMWHPAKETGTGDLIRKHHSVLISTNVIWLKKTVAENKLKEVDHKARELQVCATEGHAIWASCSQRAILQ